MMDKHKAVKFNQAIIHWFKKHGRKNLPWQINPTPYRVWVSEIMLQQTQVNTVIPYYLTFMEQLPSLGDLASASDEQVMALWSGLGYYSRARNLHKTAQLIADDCSDTTKLQLPQNLQPLMSLPGIGRSTAGAILSLSMHQRAAILDGNVKRVLARCFQIPGWPGESKVLKQLWDLSELLTPTTKADQYNQAMMDLGATLCTRTKPQCGRCPLSNICLAFNAGNQTDFPGKKKKKSLLTRKQYFYLIFSDDGQNLMMVKRPATGIWGGLWTPISKNVDDDENSFLDSYGLELQNRTKLPAFRHTFSHFHLEIHPIVSTLSATQIIKEDNCRWDSIDNWLKSGIPAAVRKMLHLIW